MWAWLLSAGSALASATAADWALALLAIAAVLFWRVTCIYGHFRRSGMPYERPVPLLGCMAPVTLGRNSFNKLIRDMYRRHEGAKAFGMFRFLQSTLVVRDPELIRAVTVKDFDHFVDRQAIGTKNGESFTSRSLPALNGQEWRDMRATLSPLFTSSKMKIIFNLIDVCGQQTVKFLKGKTETRPGGAYEADMKDVFERIANDVIATTAFGVECDSLRQPDNEFYRMGREITFTHGIRALIFIGYFFFSPRIMELLGIRFLSKKTEDFFHNTVHNTISERRKKDIFRPDMLQLLMQAREGKLKAKAGDEQEVIKGANKIQLTDRDVTAQAILFFGAGFSSVSRASSFCAYALARHPELQERVQREVDEAFAMNGGKLTYEAATMHLKYLDMFISEVQRLYANLPWISRKCTKDFTIPACGDAPAYTVRKGDTVVIPVYPIHRDPKYWENPDEFDPERFSDENKHKIQPYTYMPFGVGPRICIANRFALLEMKVALAHLLRHFSFRATPKTPKEVEYAPRNFTSTMKGGFWVGVAPRAQ